MPHYLVSPTAPPTGDEKSCETLNTSRKWWIIYYYWTGHGKSRHFNWAKTERVTTWIYRQCDVTFLIHQWSGSFPPDSETLEITWSSPRDANTKTPEEDGIGSAQKVTVLQRSQRFKKIAEGGGDRWLEGSMGRQGEGEQVGGCGFPSWLLLIFRKPLSASAISNHFLHLSLPFKYTHPPQHINAHKIQTSTSPILLFLISIPPRDPSIPLCAGLSHSRFIWQHPYCQYHNI